MSGLCGDEFEGILFHATLIEPGKDERTFHVIDDGDNERRITFYKAPRSVYFADPMRRAGRFTTIKSIRSKDTTTYEAYGEKGLSFAITLDLGNSVVFDYEVLTSRTVNVTEDVLRDMFHDKITHNHGTNVLEFSFGIEGGRAYETVDFNNSGVTVELREDDPYAEFSEDESREGHVVFRDYSTGEIALTFDYDPAEKPQISYKVERTYLY